MTNGNSLASVDQVVVLMLENRSFDHMLGFLYPGNVSPSGQPFDGLTGTESARRHQHGRHPGTWSPSGRN
jgi:phospholipase C